MDREGDPEEPHREEAGVPTPHNTIPQGLISAIADEHSAGTMAFGAIMVPNSRGPLLHASLLHSNCTCWAEHTHLAPLCFAARLRMYFSLKRVLTMHTPPGCSYLTLPMTVKVKQGRGFSPLG